MTSDESFQSASSSEGMSSYTQFSNSTPVKANSRSGPRRSAAEERDHLGPAVEDPNFLENYFVDLDPIPNVEDESTMQLITNISSAKKEIDTYPYFVKLFNKIAQFVCTIGRAGSLSVPLQFLCSHTIGPSTKYRQQTNGIAPDIWVLPPESSPLFQSFQELKDDNSSDASSRRPWSIMESMVEIKPKGEWKVKQSLDYLHTILQHRPDKVSVLGITCNQKRYRFYYIDACTQKTSKEFKWDEGLKNLAHYVYTLHRIYEENIGRDKSIRLYHMDRKNKNISTTWEISFAAQSYIVTPIVERSGCGRRTWVGVGSANDVENAASAVRVVKDMWRDNSRRYEEGNLLRRIHENGFVPGVARLISAHAFDDLTAGYRTKYRLVMGSTGLRLSACKSVLEFLKVIYDAVEAHEQVVGQGVLHRDISWYNVLCNPQHYVGNDKVLNHPNIGKILGKPDSQPLCLLTDFDNAALVLDDKYPNEGTRRTGTPMFMACELVYGSTGCGVLHDSKPGPSITLSQFALEGDAFLHYSKVYERDRYTEFNELLSSVISGKFPEVDPFAADNTDVPHRPHHDVESVYWILLWFLAKARPARADSYHGSNSEYQEEMLETIHSRMTLGHRPNGVLNLLIYADKRWKTMLHPAFHSLAKMLSDMGDYFCMCWSRFPDMPYWHSHEAFKRLLLKEIIRMTNDDTPIPIRGPRPPISDPPKTRTSILKSESRLETSRSSSSTPSGSRSQEYGSTNSAQSGKTAKRRWSNSMSAHSGNVAKKQRSSLFHGQAADNSSSPDVAGDDFDFVRVCLKNIEDDDKLWFSL